MRADDDGTRTGSRPSSISPPPSLLSAVRRDPRHAAEFALLYTLPQLSANAKKSAAKALARRPDRTVAQVAKRLVHRAVRTARRDGLVTGSSFYVGMPSAMGSIYYHQLCMVLQVAALYGHDPASPSRAPEFLYLQGRYKDVASAGAALRAALSPPRSSGRDERPGLLATIGQSVRQVPSMVGIRITELRKKGPAGIAVAAIRIATYVLPVISMPVWAAANARATRKLGTAATSFYSERAGTGDSDPGIVLPPPPGPAWSLILAALFVVLAAAAAVVVVFLTPGHHRHTVRWLLLVPCEIFLALTFGRLLWMTRPAPRTRGAD